MIGNKTLFLLLLGIIIVAWIGVSIAETIRMQQQDNNPQSILNTHLHA